MTQPTGNVGPPPEQQQSSETNYVGDTIDEQYLTEIGTESPPPMKTLVYSPDVRILVAHNDKQYDVSQDVVAVSVARVENSISTAQFRLSNKEKRYTPLFAPMDRVAIFLKRVEWVQVFSGYIDKCGLAALYPGTTDIRASCTLKRLAHTWWDPGLPESAKIFDQFKNEETDGQEKQLDAGLGSTLRRLLIEVGNWDSKNVHIQRFPTGYMNFMEEQVRRYNGTDEAVEKFRWMLLGDDTSGGVGPAAGRQLGVTKGGYALAGAPERKLEVIRAVDEMGMGVDNRNLAAAQGLGVASAGGKDLQDQEAWKTQTEVTKNWTEAAMKNDAAVHCFMTIAVESNWVMYANASVPGSQDFPHEALSTDHDSVGLYQQRNNGAWGTVDQRMNVRESTGMFLRELDKYDWRNMDRGAACQSVQRSAFPGKYSEFEQVAIEEVRALRGGTGAPAGAAGQSGGIPGLGTTPVGTAPPPITAGAPGFGNVPAVPTTNGTPSATAAAAAVGRPQFDLQAAINFGMSQQGKPYVWGAKGPASYDCSGLTKAVYRSIGIEIGPDTYTQVKEGVGVASLAQAKPGDLLFPSDVGHVAVWLGGGMILHAPQPGDVVKIAPLYFEPAHIRHYPPAEYVGPGTAAGVDPTGALGQAPGAAPGTVAQGSNGGTFQTGSTEPIARNLFSYMFEPGRFINYTSSLFGAGGTGSPREAAFINDEPLIQSVVGLCKAGLRNFQSLPNGDFCAYYPDFFGLDGKDAVMDLEDIEMKNVTIDLNDDALATHVYVAGTMNPRGASMGIMGWLNTKGIATVENEWLFRRMAAAAPQVKGAEMRRGTDILKKYGARPLTQDMSAIQNGKMEFLMALQIFMTKWAEQYATQVEFAFMPELYPGMRINLVGHNLQVYVSAVTHSGDFENGFTTTATIMAPSTPNIRRIAQQLDDLSHGQKWDQRDIDNQSSNWWWKGRSDD